MTHPTRALTTLALAAMCLATNCGGARGFVATNETGGEVVVVVLDESTVVRESSIPSKEWLTIGPGNRDCLGDRIEARADDGTVIATHPDGPCTPNEWIIHGPDDTQLLPYPR